MIRTVVLPSALPGIVTGIILSAGKIIGEAAALIFTMGTSNPGNVFTLNPLIGSDNLTIRIWYVQTLGAGAVDPKAVNSVSAGGAAVLVLLLLIINLASRGIGRVIQRRVTAA
jgi:phosphate transport system permease protein